MKRPVAALLALAAAVVAAGCGDTTSITDGGRVAGTTLTVYSLLPQGNRGPAARDLVLGEKLALQQARGRAGGFSINYVAAPLPAGGGQRAVAAAVREVMRDPGVAAVIGDLGLRTARVSVPLLNAAGILHVSPAVTYPGFERRLPRDPGAPDRYRPSGRRSFVPLVAGDEAAALTRAARGAVAIEATAGAPERALAEQVRRALPETVDTADADTVIVLAPNPDDALGVVEGVLAENRRARVLLPEELWQTDLPAPAPGPAPRRLPHAHAAAVGRGQPGLPCHVRARARPVGPGRLRRDALRPGRRGPGGPARRRPARVDRRLPGRPPARPQRLPARPAHARRRRRVRAAGLRPGRRRAPAPARAGASRRLRC